MFTKFIAKHVSVRHLILQYGHVCMSVTLWNAIINAWFTQSMYFTYSTWQDFIRASFRIESGAAGKSERSREIARLREQRQRHCTSADYLREEARQHQQASRARETGQ